MSNSIRPLLTRRALLGSALAAGGFLAFGGRRPAFAEDDLVEEISKLKPGQYVWHPDRSPDGPVAIVVVLPTQLCHVYRNGIRIAVSTVSTGKPGFTTPSGVFTILQKDKVHFSSTYDEAPMPYTERLTWSGVALHAGGLPGYPSSHGCVHLPLKFASELFGITQVGTPVIVAGDYNEPVAVVHPGLVLGQYAESELDKEVATEKSPPAVDETEHTSIIVSSADKRIDILVNGDVVASGTATIDSPTVPLGQNVFILSASDPAAKTLTWHAVSFSQDSDAPASDADPNAVIRRIHGDDAVVNAIKARMSPGLVLVTTDLPLSPENTSGKDFVVMSTETS